MTNEYLSLTEYSSKYKVSISTLRRRIKADDIRFVFEEGKYFLLDTQGTSPVSTHQRVHRPSPRISEWKSAAPKAATFSETLVSAPQHSERSGAIVSEAAPFFAHHANAQGTSAPKKVEAPLTTEEPVLAAANRLLTELKKAYSQILHEKEEQVMHLKEELADLKTLVRVLESENDRLSRRLK